MSQLETYVVYCRDKPGTAALRDENLIHHRAYLASQPLRILLAGPILTEDRSRSVGSFIFVEAASREEVVAFNTHDPFHRLGLWETVEIHPFTVARHAYGHPTQQESA